MSGGSEKGLDTDTSLVEALLDVDSGLTEWELDFVDNLGRQVIDQQRELSEKQRAKAEEIRDRLGL